MNIYIKRHNKHTNHRKQRQTPNTKELNGERENIKVRFLPGRRVERGRRNRERKETIKVYMF
jgi:hypothetical protein